MAKFYVTTAIPYVNARPHLGFALELVQADVVARMRREMGDDVRFLTGTDENSIKNVRAAEKAGIPVQNFVDENANIYLLLTKLLNIKISDFIRTTETRHKMGAQKFWEACKRDIFQKEYEGLYCDGCEMFYSEKELESGLCAEHKTKPELVREKNYFFGLSKYAEFLTNAFETWKIRIYPKGRRNEVLNFIKGGLEDFSISRSNERAKNWGVDVPDDASQKMYVWFDALTNYINALGYGSADASLFEKYWNAPDSNIFHVIGKGITRFHAIYWPAMLESAGMFPKNGLDILVHGYVTVNGEKISKSLGNTVDPFELVEKYGGDTVRYFLLREIPTTEDGDFSIEKFEERYNADLANGLGNLVQRVTVLADKHQLKNMNRATDVFAASIKKMEKRVFALLGQYEFHLALGEIWHLVALGDCYVDEQKPWQKKEEDIDQILADLSVLVLHIAKLLRPFLPQTSQEIFSRFCVPADVKEVSKNLEINIKKGDPLFKRI